MKPAPFIFRIALAAACLAVCAHAQVTVEPETAVTTDSIDLFSQSQAQQKSPGIAIAATLVLPGSGHHYLGRDRSALAYLTADAMSIFAFFFCDHYAKKTALDAAGYAWIHSGASGPISDADDNYWRVVGNFMDVQDYNNAMDLNRTPEEKIIDESRIWHWDDKSSQDRFNAIRSSSRSFRIISSFFLGALVLDRVVAFIDIRSTTRNRGMRQQGLSPLELKPLVSATPGSIDLNLVGSF